MKVNVARRGNLEGSRTQQVQVCASEYGARVKMESYI